MRFQTLDGEAACMEAGPKRAPRLSKAEGKLRRNLLWLNATERGFPDPMTGEDRIYTISELSQLWACSERNVRLGIASARAELAAIERL